MTAKEKELENEAFNKKLEEIARQHGTTYKGESREPGGTEPEDGRENELTILEETQKKVDQMIADRDKELDSLETALTKDEQDIEKARALMDGATDRGDLASYQAAKAKLQNALDSKEMHARRRTLLLESPLIDRPDYESMCKALTDAMDTEVSEAVPKLAAATENLEAIGDSVKKDADRTNDLLRKIQSQLYRNQDRQKRADGQFIGGARSYKGHFNCVEWSREASNGDTYRQYKRQQEIEKQKEAAKSE